MFTSLLLTCAIFTSTFSEEVYKIPEDFLIGCASSAYQVEGGWNASGKGENIWDHITHINPNFNVDSSNGDVACDSYHKWEEDVKLLKQLGVNHYRFSISWSRILPYGYSNEINPDGLRYYNNLIDALLENNIEPVVTMYHFDLPQDLQNLGGMANLKIAEYAVDYARVLFKNFGDRVKWWITFNEPLTYCSFGYTGVIAPAIISPGVGVYLCGKTILVGHGMIYRMYKKEFKEKQNGKIGITINTYWFQPKTSSPEDIEATKRTREILFGWWMNPIFSKEGNYPQLMIDRIGNVSKGENFSESRLPPLTKDQIKLIRGAFDFLGLNYYTGKTVRANLVPPYNPPTLDQDTGATVESIKGLERSGAAWLDVYPEGLEYLLECIKTDYHNPPILITENGYPDNDGRLNDPRRINYIQKHVIAILKAIKKGSKVFGYTYWGMMDDFEWNSGYTYKFGVIQVNFTSPNRTRTLKLSAHFFKVLTECRVVPSGDIV